MRYEITVPQILNPEAKKQTFAYSELTSLAFELGDKGDFVSTRAFQLIKDQLSEESIRISFQHSFEQAQDFKDFDGLMAKLDSL